MPTPLPFPHQVTGALYLAEPGHRLLGDEPGLGKSRQVIDAANRIGAKRILILCQSIGVLVWKQQFELWDKVGHLVFVVHSRLQHMPADCVAIASYDMVSRGEPHLLRLLYRNWDVLVLDEADMLRNIEAKRTRLILGEDADLVRCLGARAGRIWALSGTPAPKHAGELWTLMRALAPHLITDPRKRQPLTLTEFQDRYCRWIDTPQGRRVTGSRNMLTLAPKLRSFMLRRRKKDVLRDLPPLRFAILPVSPEMADVSQELLAEFEALDHDIRVRVGGHGPDEFLAVLAGLESYSTYRRLTGRLKASIAVKLIDQELIDPRRKLIVFAHHLDVIDHLGRELTLLGHDPVTVTGQVTGHARARNVVRFQTRPECRVFIGQTLAAGASITLTASSDVLFVEPSTVPRDNVQAACRAHRIGQRNGVLARYMTMAGSIDDPIMSIILRRTEELAHLFDDDRENMGAPPKQKRAKP